MRSREDNPVWRSLLFVPINREKFVERAHLRGADGLILDLEDSIPASEKERARRLVEKAAEKVGRSGSDVLVRINRPLGLAVRDLEASVLPGVCAIAVTKVASASHLRLLAETIAECEIRQGLPEGHTRVLAMVESAEAFLGIAEIARAHPRVIALTLGSEDFALSAGMQPDAEGLLYPHQQVVLAARAACIAPLGFVGTVAEFRALDVFRAKIRQARRLGFEGALCIHPDQVRILNEEFRPQPVEVEQARRIVEADARARAEGRGSFELDDKMIDAPVVLRAEALLRRHAAIEARAQNKAE